ncbi:MAG: peroxiredoxin [Ignavibacteriota bacterium]
MFSWLWSNPLPAGSVAPEFSLPDESGRVVRLADWRGSHVVLVFYPADDTSVCTRQLCQFRDSWSEAQARAVQVFGVNPQNARRHGDFRKKYSLPFPLLVDRGQKVGALYRANGLIVKRTVVLDRSRRCDSLFAKRCAPRRRKCSVTLSESTRRSTCVVLGSLAAIGTHDKLRAVRLYALSCTTPSSASLKIRST